MVDLNTLLIFIPVALALNITPGTDMMFCLGQGAKSGTKAGIAAAIGVSAGGMVHALAGGLGLAAAIAASPVAFEVIRWSGVGYLLYLAIQTVISPSGALQPTEVGVAPVWQAFKDGMLVNLLNPKVAIFMLALVPQFVDPAVGSVLGQFLIFGTVLSIGGAFVNGGVGAFSGQIRQYLSTNNRAAQVLQYITASVFVALAAKMETFSG